MSMQRTIRRSKKRLNWTAEAWYKIAVSAYRFRVKFKNEKENPFLSKKK